MSKISMEEKLRIEVAIFTGVVGLEISKLESGRDSFKTDPCPNKLKLASMFLRDRNRILNHYNVIKSFVDETIDPKITEELNMSRERYEKVHGEVFDLVYEMRAKHGLEGKTLKEAWHRNIQDAFEKYARDIKKPGLWQRLTGYFRREK